jgi:DNA polymerase elongation subunit (family B)
MDIETYVKDNLHIPYCISFYDGSSSFSYYLKNYKDPDDMIISCIRDLMVKKYDNYKVYIHNLSEFDANFLLKILANLGQIKPIIHHNDIISINFKFRSYSIDFRDSLQILI